MSSHREAPGISKDPVADSTDLYAFVSPDKPDTVTLIANYVPLESPAGGPNFYEFGDDVLYQIHIDNNGDGFADITFAFQFRTFVADDDTFLYNVGPIESISSPNWNRRQFYSVGRWRAGERTVVLAENLPCPPCNIGPLSTPNYPVLANEAVHWLPGDVKVFAGQRAEGFYVDLGSIFDLGDLRPFASDHDHYGLSKFPTNGPGVNATASVNVHTIAIQLPITALTDGGRWPNGVDDPKATIGVWTTASRQRSRIYDVDHAMYVDSGPFTQVSRLGNPLVNEVLIPLGKKDFWNTQAPGYDKQFAAYFAHPGLSELLPALYPGVFPNLAALDEKGSPRADIEAILLTGIPKGIIPGFQNYTGATQADMLRLNVAIKPSDKPSIYGILGGDLAGYPNGRRVFDDVVTIELRALAGATYGLVDKAYKPDAAASLVTDGLTPADLSSPYLCEFPFLGVPHSGFYTPDSNP
jgi:hypothetical protein